MTTVLPTPIVIIAGKDLDEAFELALSATGPRESLDGLAAWELRASRTHPTPAAVAWSVESGHIAVADDQVILHVPGDETEALAAPGQQMWRFLLSYGETPGVAEKPLLEDQFLLRAEP